MGIRNYIDNWPKTSFIVISKLYWLTSFFWSVYVIQGEIPTLKQWMLGSLYTLVTLPLSYWLTYSFGEKK
jgi:hypothetical protein